MPSSSAFGFGLMVPIKEGWRVELRWGQLRQNLANRSHTTSSRPTAAAWADAAKDTPPMPTIIAGKEDDIARRVYNLPIPSQNLLPDEYERDEDDDKKDEKFAQRTLHPRPLLPPGVRL